MYKAGAHSCKLLVYSFFFLLLYAHDGPVSIYVIAPRRGVAAATQPVIRWMELGGKPAKMESSLLSGSFLIKFSSLSAPTKQPKWLPLSFEYNDVMHTSSQLQLEIFLFHRVPVF